MMFFQIVSLFALLQKYWEEILEAQSNYSPLRARAKRLQKLCKNLLKVVRYGADGGGSNNIFPATNEQICSLGIN